MTDIAQVSQRAIDLIVTEEDSDPRYYARHYTHFDWPAGASGPTVGIGYDCGYVTAAELKADWADIVSDATIAALRPAVGIQGETAHRFVLAHKTDVTITWDQALAEFTRREVPKWCARVRAALPNTDKLAPDSFGALLSLAYNRGASFGNIGSRYVEMRAVKAHMAAGALDRIPADIRAMKRLWPAGSGVWKRREHEAVLFERGLATTMAA